jgi:hypothetical protein
MPNAAAAPTPGAPLHSGYRQSVGAAMDSFRNMHVSGAAPAHAAHAAQGHM